MITIRKFKRADTKTVATLVAKTYEEFCSNEGNPKAVDRYINYFNTKTSSRLQELEGRFANAEIIYVALNNEKIVGMVRGGRHRVSNLFVDGQHHRQGIGTRLMKIFEAAAKQKGSEHINIRASMYANKFYQKLGYKKTTGQRIFHGLKIQPLKKILI
jgi:predicted N-acetyltransferase YhbS